MVENTDKGGRGRIVWFNDQMPSRGEMVENTDMGGG